MKTMRYFSGIVMLLMLAVATSCSDSDAIKSIEDKVTHTATMTLSGDVRGFDDSRADAEGWSDGDKLYLNFSTNNGAVSGVATYNKSIDSWSVTYSGTLTEGAATKCEAYFFDGETSQNGTEVTFNALTAVYADKSAYYVCKDGAISLTATLVPQTARFRFKGTPGTEFSVSGCESYAGFSSQSLQQSSTEVRMKIDDDGYSPYIYGFLADENNTLVVRSGDWKYTRSVSGSDFVSGKSGWFSLPTENIYSGWEKNVLNKTITVNGVTFKMIKVEAGTFTMGATSEQTGAARDESPAHQVTLTKDYYMGETEVTQALWYAVMGQKPTADGVQWSSEHGLGDNYPAYSISWNDCQEFITKLNQLTGLTFRLPTEAEWEYAARGGNKATTQTLYSGSNTIGDVAWYGGNSSSSTQIVAGKKANVLGLYDMSGNLYEWCNDWYDWYDSYSSSPQTDPTGPSGGSNRVLRGGSWYLNATYCRVAYRNGSSVTNRNSYYGMRLAL